MSAEYPPAQPIPLAHTSEDSHDPPSLTYSRPSAYSELAALELLHSTCLGLKAIAKTPPASTRLSSPAQTATLVPMAPTAPQTTKKAKSVPKTVADFTILPLTLSALPGLPDQCNNAKHYIYVKPHAPSIPSESDERSLFIVNVPIDASETSVRALFVEQLGGSMVERVEFDSSVPAQPLHKRWKSDTPKAAAGSNADAGAGDTAARGKKRKRTPDDPAMVAEGVVEDAESALPKLWGSELRRSGSAAVVVFVDRKSARGAMKTVQKAVHRGQEIVWRGTENMGVERKLFPLLYLPSFVPQVLLLHTKSSKQS